MNTFLLLQLCGGTLYLLSKVFLSMADGNLSLRRIGWSVYIAGVPFWMAILWIKTDYIVLGLEFGGGLMLVYGLIKTFQPDAAPYTMWDKTADGSCVILFLMALIFTINTKGFGFHPFLEVVVASTFAVSAMLLARQDTRGWYVLLLMHFATGYLMYEQQVYWLTMQQTISSLFALWAIYKANQTPIARRSCNA